MYIDVDILEVDKKQNKINLDGLGLSTNLHDLHPSMFRNILLIVFVVVLTIMVSVAAFYAAITSKKMAKNIVVSDIDWAQINCSSDSTDFTEDDDDEGLLSLVV